MILMANMEAGRGLTPIGYLPECLSPYGIYDLSGNVWEWVSDWYDKNYYRNTPYKNPKGPSHGKDKANRALSVEGRRSASFSIFCMFAGML